jgi:ABC-type multidrug transport system ATPase subunit
MLAVTDLTHVYADHHKALDGVTLDIPPGMFGLLGPNGAGKSTLMRIIATLQTPTSGSVRFGDVDVLSEPQRLRAMLGYLPQDFGVYPRVTAREMLDHLAVLKGFSIPRTRREMVDALLAQVNLWEVRNKAIASFSGGMRQRFGIAQALIGDPKLIIVDEPTAGLDPEERNRFLNLLAGIADTVAVILSTHIVADVADLCPRMAILARGRIVAQGAPQNLMSGLAGRVWTKNIPHQALREHLDRYNVISSRLASGRTIIHALSDDPPGEGFLPVSGDLEDFYFATLSGLRPAGGR